MIDYVTSAVTPQANIANGSAISPTTPRLISPMESLNSAALTNPEQAIKGLPPYSAVEALQRLQTLSENIGCSCNPRYCKRLRGGVDGT